MPVIRHSQLSAETFATYTRPKLLRHSGIQALEWIPMVTAVQRPGYETAVGKPIRVKGTGSGIENGKICFEITETAAIPNMGGAIKFISTLKALGCQFALDDFGSGLSSFGYLKNLPVDFLKIDGMFVKNITTDPIDHAMIKSINEMGHVMGMKTIAEFVENDLIMGMLREIGVDYAQGYGVSLPGPLTELLIKRKPDSA